MRAEMNRRQSATEKVLEHFLAHPRTWINALDLQKIGGHFAWRTRCSEARKILEKRGLTIENRQTHQDGVIVSEYRLKDFPLGRDAGTVETQRGLF